MIHLMSISSLVFFNAFKLHYTYVHTYICMDVAEFPKRCHNTYSGIRMYIC